MRYHPQDGGHSSSLSIEAQPQQPSISTIFPLAPTALTTPASYAQDAGAFYPTTSQLIHLDPRPRLGSNPTTTTGMAHAHRSAAALSHSQISAREQYSPATPTFRRPSEHPSRSPSYPGPSLRRQPLSPTPSPIAGFTTPVRMDPTSYATKGGSIPPLGPLVTEGRLEYGEPPQATRAEVDIMGTIDKGFFLAENEWTCYRRNYFSCVCSFTINPPYYPSTALHLVREDGTFSVDEFAMCISAVVADDGGQTIDLVQHTPKRDKGPVNKPEKIPLSPRMQQPPHHVAGYHGHDSAMGGTRPPQYEQSYPPVHQGGGALQTEGTFERIQFKQATANNGKRRAAQQYYHLLVELWAKVPVGNGASPAAYYRVAYKKSAKMIVRGRSPGHYQTERRGSTSSGPGGSNGSLGPGYPSSSIMGQEYAPAGGSMLPGNFSSGYDRSGGGGGVHHYDSVRHHASDIPPEPVIPSEDAKAIDHAKGYQYYPHTIYESQHDGRPEVDMFTHNRTADHEHVPHHGFDPVHGRIKSEQSDGGPSGALPSLFQPGPLLSNRQCRQFEGKPSSGGYYPMMPQSGMNIANIT